ncbi:dolichyl-phosphate beta-D-mannosyltransferase, partial [Halobacteriales archaeon QS_6_71_20]
YNRRAIESLADDETIGDHMSASLDILYHAHTHGYEIEEVATTIDYGIEEGSSQHPLQHGIALVMSIVRTIERERPITILGVPGVLSTALGVGLGYWAFSLYLRSGGLPTGPALLSSVFTILGILAAFTAIILHSLAVYHE